VLGGWSATAAVVVTVDMVLIAVLLLVSDRRASGAESQDWRGSGVPLDADALAPEVRQAG
jgi:hypothetical protein